MFVRIKGFHAKGQDAKHRKDDQVSRCGGVYPFRPYPTVLTRVSRVLVALYDGSFFRKISGAPILLVPPGLLAFALTLFYLKPSHRRLGPLDTPSRLKRRAFAEAFGDRSSRFKNSALYAFGPSLRRRARKTFRFQFAVSRRAAVDACVASCSGICRARLLAATLAALRSAVCP